MPLVKATLESAIRAACAHQEKEFTIDQFASALADAIHGYVSAMTVTVTTIEAPGSVTVCGAGPGTVTVPSAITSTATVS